MSLVETAVQNGKLPPRKPKQSSKAAPTDTSAQPDASAPTDIIPYDDAVAEGKAIRSNIEAAEGGQLRLGELADRVEAKYGDRTQAKLADAIGIARCTLDRYRTVYRAWKDILAPGPNSDPPPPPPYAVCRELATHPRREQIILAHPDLTKSEALDEMRKFKGKTKEAKEQEQEDEWLKHSRDWFKEVVALCNEAVRMADVPNQCTPEQLDKLLQAVDPKMLMYLYGGGRMLFKLAVRLAEKLGEEVQQFASARGEA
jgi:hypothetical protein